MAVVMRSAVVVGREKRSEPAESADHLVHDHQDAGVVAQRSDLLEIVQRARRDASARVLHRLENDRRHLIRPIELNQAFDLVVTGTGAGRGVLAVRAAVPVRHGRMPRPGHERSERRPGVGQAVDRKRSHRGAMISNTARNGLPAMRIPMNRVVLLGELERALDSFRSSGRKEDARLAAERGQVRKPLRQNRRRDADVPKRVDVRQLRGLGGHRMDDALPPVTGVHRIDAGQEIEMRIAVEIPERDSLAADNHERPLLGILEVGHLGEVQPGVVAHRVLDAPRIDVVKHGSAIDRDRGHPRLPGRILPTDDKVHLGK